MKTKVTFALGLISMVAAVAPATAEVPKLNPPPLTTVSPVNPRPVALVQSIPLECSGAGASDVVSRKHSIKNTAGHAIPKGTKISWTASNNGAGSLTLQSDLPPNDTVEVVEPGQTNGYTCKASFNPGSADFVVKSVKWTSDTTASVEIANQNPWVDAAASVVRVQSLKCLSTPVASVDVGVGAIAKGSSTVVSAKIAKASADYLQATANASGSAPESNKSNNVGKSPEFGSNKSCTPQ